jgi:hypothetical protein
MAGAGSDPSGIGPAGFDPIRNGSSVSVNAPNAIRYEGATRDWPLDANGQYQRIHWVEQAFALGCCTRKGKIKSAPNVGHTLFELKVLGGLNLSAEIEDRLRNAIPIASLLKNREAEITRIEHSSNPQGQLRVAVYFKNLVVDRTRVLRADAVI